MADPEANIIFGAVIDDRLSDEIRVTVIATGFEPRKTKTKMEMVMQQGITPLPKFKGPALEIPDWMKRK